MIKILALSPLLRPGLLLLLFPLIIIPLQAQTTVIYQHTFSGDSSTSLHGQPIDVDPGGTGNTWNAHSSWKADGASGLYSTATVPFEPQSGFIYHLSASFRDVTGDDYWLALGFTAGSSTASGQRFLGSPTTGYAWMLRRGNNATQPDQLFAGPATANGISIEPSLDHSRDVDLMILLDTRNESWQVQWYQKYAADFYFTQIHTFTYSTNPDIHAVGFASGQNTIHGRLKNFNLLRIESNLEITPDGQPQDTAIYGSQPVEFVVRFTTNSQPVAVWHRLQEGIDTTLPGDNPDIVSSLEYNDATDAWLARLIMTDANADDEGAYYCILSDESVFPVVSTAARLQVNALLTYWPLGQAEVADNRYLDRQGGHHADITGLPAFVLGAHGQDAAASEITPEAGWASSSPLRPIGFTGEFSIAFWYRWNGLQDMTSAAGDLMVESIWNGTSRLDHAAQPGHWQFFCVTFDGTTGRTYLDGRIKTTESWHKVDPGRITVDLGHASGAHTFNGALDDVRIFNYALSDAQVVSLFTEDVLCILSYAQTFDLTGPNGSPDCRVDLYDLRILLDNWMSCGIYPRCQ